MQIMQAVEISATGRSLIIERVRVKLREAALAVTVAFGVFAGTSLGAHAQEMWIDLGKGGPVQPVLLSAGHTVTINTDVPFVDILVGNPSVADVFPLSDMSVYVQGNAFGTTNVTFLGPDKKMLGTAILRVEIDTGDMQAAIDQAVPSARVDATNVNGRIRLSGSVKDNVDLERVLGIASQYTQESIINAVRVTDPQQVQLDVRILEVSRNAGRELGVNLSRKDSKTGVTPSSVPFGTFVGNILSIAGGDVNMVINALESKGLARRLANPTLVTTSGIEANFVVGGEVPISKAVAGENGSVGSETAYREYGVRLNFRPVVLDDAQISLRIRPEVSDVDTSVNVNGQPAFISRKADTTVTLRDGQSFAIAGLLQVDNERDIKQVPWIGQIPIIGSLFRSSQFSKQETDLVILVTPRIVTPGTPYTPLKSPLENSRSSNDVELFLLGMLEVNKDMIRSFQDGEGIVGPYGHIIDLEFDDAVITKK